MESDLRESEWFDVGSRTDLGHCHTFNRGRPGEMQFSKTSNLKKSSSKYILSRDKSLSSVWYSVIRPLGREMNQTQADMRCGRVFLIKDATLAHHGTGFTKPVHVLL
jgi:hypothetical protein